jgi:uncharacterized protein
MQQSLFNVRVPLAESGDVFLMNTLTDAQAIVPASIDALLRSLGDGPLDDATLTHDARESLGVLAENGFIVSNHETERRALDGYFRDIRESRDELRVTVLTTLQCNFACDYCYQGDHPGAAPAEKMSLETAVRVGDWIERRLDEVAPERFSILFFGGEPLLNPGVVLYLSERLWKATRRRGVRMSSSIVTNGLLLSRDLVARLVAFGLRGIKVTLDGDRDTHNRVRPLRGGQGTFDRIIANIRNVADLVAISIGGNFDERTIESYPALLDFLRGQDFAPQLAKVAFKPIIREQREPGAATQFIPLTSVDASGKPLNGTCMTVAGSGATNMCDTCQLLDEKMAWLREETKRRGFSTIDGVHMGPCQIHRSNSHTVGPDGSLYACPGFTGARAYAVGHIESHENEQLSRSASRFDNVDAWKRCGDCAFIPVCAGGCSVAAHAALGDITAPSCHKASFELGVAALAREAAANEILAYAS